MRTLSLLILICAIPATVFCQSPGADKTITDSSGKLSPSLQQTLKTQKGQLRLIVGVSNAQQFNQRFKKDIQVVREYNTNVLLISASAALIKELAASPMVRFMDLADRSPKEELIVEGFDLGTNRINVVHERFPALTGENLMVSIKENRFDSTDIDLKGRVFNSGIASATNSGHATIMATMMAGAGNSYYQGKGAAWKANMQSATFSSLLPEADAFYKTQRISVQNHSYGTAIENYYGADAAAYDASVVNNPVLLHVFSSGNSGLLPSNGPYNGITGFANITGSFKMAKNNLVVGATDSLGNIEGPSSKGPAYDGRIKPELVAFGQDGSSGSAAIVSGISLLLQQAYAQQHNDSLAPAALVKAMLINTADDVGAKGPDRSSGYGSANAYKAIQSMQQAQFFTNSIQQGNTQTFQLNIPAGIRMFRCTLAWTDIPALANAAKALQNDIDLELTHVPTGQTWQPWILPIAANYDSLVRGAGRGKDTLNNVEQITLDAPPAGNYILSVKGSKIINAQTYYIAYAADTADKFEWLFPMSHDPVTAGTAVLLRFNSGFNTAAGQLQYSLADGNWQTISATADLTKKYFRWNAPDTFSVALVRMIINGTPYVSDTFVLSKRISTQIGFNCADSFLFFWKRPPGINSFRVYKVGSKFLEPVTVTNDTFYVNASSAVNSKQFTIAPLLKNREGIKAYTFNYSTQGTSCYFKTFLAQLLTDKAQLSFEIGTLYNVSNIIIQKLSGNSFKTISTISNPADLQYIFDDVTLQQGANIYRIALQLKDGRIIYSSTEVVYNIANADFIVFPNPSRVATGFKILQKEPNSFQLLIHDVTGRIVKNESYSDLVNNISTINLQKGLYVITIWREGKKVFTGKVVLQ
jgi:hypothetical protein